jgi:GH15 family glucan-1,4-alpha-glucosidase
MLEAVLRGLTSGGGGMVAAATTSLPERADRDRNYDYRYAWIRDQAYACGPPGLLSEEYDVTQRQLRGNLPQAFVHACCPNAPPR